MNRTWAHLLLILMLCGLSYSNTLDASLHLDDRDYITANPYFKSFSLWPDPARYVSGRMTNTNVVDTLRTRYIAYLTLYANGSNLTALHLTNIAIHLINAVLVYFFVLLLLQSPALARSSIGADARLAGVMDKGRLAALTAAMLFVAHPVQTQAVTYISQRFTSLAALFYLGALVAYARWRLGGARAFYAMALISACMAMMSKEIAFTLPVMVVIFEFMFFEGAIKARLAGLAPIAATMLIIPAWLLSVSGISGAVGRAAAGLSRMDYLLTQLTVIPKYLRLLFIPLGQNFDYQYPIYHSAFEPAVMLGAAVLAIVAAASGWAWRAGRRGRPELLIAAFGIWWFFLALAVESSVFPLNDMIFEHRAYLPSIGIVMAVVAGASMLSRNALVVLCAASLALGAATYQRNAVWHGEISLWEDTVNKSPQKRRPRYNLSMAYRAAGMKEQAVEQYKIAMSLPPDAVGELYGMDESMEEVLDDRIIEHFRKVLGVDADLSEVYTRFGLMYEGRHNYEKAIELYRKALVEHPGYVDALVNLGSALMTVGKPQEAAAKYREAITVAPRIPGPHNNLGIYYLQKGQAAEAVREFDAVLAIDPNFAMARQMRDYAAKMIKSK